MDAFRTSIGLPESGVADADVLEALKARLAYEYEEGNALRVERFRSRLQEIELPEEIRSARFLTEFRDGYAVIKTDDWRTLIITDQGEIIGEPTQKDGKPWKNNEGKLKNRGYGCFLGRDVYGESYYFRVDDEEGACAAYTNVVDVYQGKVIDTTDLEIYELDFRGADAWTNANQNGVFGVTYGIVAKQYAYVDADGDMLFQVTKADDNTVLSEMSNDGYAVVKTSSAYDLYDSEGNLLREVKGENLVALGEGLFVQDNWNENSRLANAEGETIGSKNPGMIHTDYVNGLPLVIQDGKCGYANTKGELVIPLEWEDHNWVYDWNKYAFMNNGYAYVTQNERYGLIDRNGNVMIEPAYRDAVYSDSDTIVLCGEDGWHFFTVR